MVLFDNTLRDGGNVVGHGFSLDLTESIVRGLLNAGIPDIELGNCKGLGAYDQLHATNAPSDDEYFKILQPYLPKGRIGMFILAKCANTGLVKAAAAAVWIHGAAGDLCAKRFGRRSMLPTDMIEALSEILR